jgi:hypothetical protein
MSPVKSSPETEDSGVNSRLGERPRLEIPRPDRLHHPAGGLEAPRPFDADDSIEREILKALQGLQFGEVTIKVRDGRVVQIEQVCRSRQILSRPPE